jgi:hypothetical protein
MLDVVALRGDQRPLHAAETLLFPPHLLDRDTQSSFSLTAAIATGFDPRPAPFVISNWKRALGCSLLTSIPPHRFLSPVSLQQEGFEGRFPGRECVSISSRDPIVTLSWPISIFRFHGERIWPELVPL